MVEIKQRIVSKSVQEKVTSGGTNTRKTLTVHQTGNTSKGANAEMHARLQENGNSRSASWHIQSDDKEIIQSFPFTAQTWHAGDGRGDGNRHSISWEICINSDGNYLKSLELASEGIAQVLKQEGLTVADLRQHYDWSKKNCPAQIRAGKDGVDWNRFKEMVQEHMTAKPVATPKPQTKTINQLAQEVIDGKYGTGEARRKALGNQYSSVQKRVNEILAPNAKPTPVRKNNATIAQEVIDGKWGNNPQRKQKLEKAGYNYAAIQAEVNKRFGVKTKPKKSVGEPTPSIGWTGQVLRQGMRGAHVRQLQEMLAKRYFYPDKGAKNNGIDGIYGAKTKNAVERFQTMNGLTVDGIAGRATYNKLR